MNKTHAFVLTAWLLALSWLAIVLGLFTGSLGWEWGLAWHDPIVQDIRLPRTLGAWMAGALLGLAGALAQGLFRNPLADPYLLGSASGASLGVAVALSLGMGWVSHVADMSEATQWLMRLGLTGMAELPSAPWQLTQTPLKMADPLAGSALAGAAPSACALKIKPVTLTDNSSRTKKVMVFE